MSESIIRNRSEILHRVIGSFCFGNVCVAIFFQFYVNDELVWHEKHRSVFISMKSPPDVYEFHTRKKWFPPVWIIGSHKYRRIFYPCTANLKTYANCYTWAIGHSMHTLKIFKSIFVCERFKKKIHCHCGFLYFAGTRGRRYILYGADSIELDKDYRLLVVEFGCRRYNANYIRNTFDFQFFGVLSNKRALFVLLIVCRWRSFTQRLKITFLERYLLFLRLLCVYYSFNITTYYIVNNAIDSFMYSLYRKLLFIKKTYTDTIFDLPKLQYICKLILTLCMIDFPFLLFSSMYMYSLFYSRHSRLNSL